MSGSGSFRATTTAAEAPAVRGRSRAAFERSCIPPSVVALRSNTARYAPSSRLAGRAPDRSRCDADSCHGLLIEDLPLLPALDRLPGRDQEGHGRPARRPLRPDAGRGLGAGPARRRPGLRLDQLHRAPFPHRGLRALEQPRPARPVHRHADEEHPGRPAGDRAASEESDPGGRGHRDARPDDRGPGQRGLRARLPAALGRRDGAADARNLGRPAAPAGRDRRDEPGRLRGVLPDHQEGMDGADAGLRRPVLEDPGRRSRGRDAVDARGDGAVGRRRRGRRAAPGRRGAETGAEAPSAGLPALRVVGGEHPLVRAGRRDRDPAPASPKAGAGAVRTVRRGIRAASGRGDRRPARHRDRRYRR